MHTSSNRAAVHDPLPEIIQIIRDAIKEGLINEPLERFDAQVSILSGADCDGYILEDYIQAVWDKI